MGRMDFDLDKAEAMIWELDLECNSDGGGGGGDDLDLAANAAPAINNEKAMYQDIALLPPNQPILFERMCINHAINVNQVLVGFPHNGWPKEIDNFIYMFSYTGPLAV